MTERLLVLLFERAFVEMTLAERANEMFGMKFLVHGRDAAAVDGLLTRGAQATALEMIVQLAVGHRVVLEEARRLKRCATLLTHEALRMPVRVQSRYEVVDDRALTALAFRC